MFNTEPRSPAISRTRGGRSTREHYYLVEADRSRSGRGSGRRLPDGETRVYLGVPVLEGHINYRGMDRPDLGGSMFEALMVTLIVPEERWAPKSWGVNHPLYVRAQIEHGMDERNTGSSGASPPRAALLEGGDIAATGSNRSWSDGRRLHHLRGRP